MQGLADLTGRIVFNEGCHFYIMDYGTEDARMLTGITTLMEKHGLGHQYPVPPGYTAEEWQATLDHAAEVGTMAHKCIESYCNGEATVLNPLIKSFKKLGLNIVATEYLVSDLDVAASAIDLVDEVGDGVYNLIDIKRTNTLHEDSLYWQLGAYRYLFLLANPDAKVNACYALHIEKGNKDNIDKDKVKALTEVKVASEEEVKAWLAAEKRGDIFIPDIPAGLLIIPDEIRALLAAQLPQLLALQQQVAVVEDSIKSAKDWLYEQMLATGVDEVTIGGVKIRLKHPYMKTALDTKSLKESHPDIAEQFMKQSTVKGSVSITTIE